MVLSNLYVTFGVIAIIIGSFAYLLPPAQNISSELYKFVSESLVTIFAVVLSLTFIFVEISTKPSAAMDKLLNNKNFRLIYFFFFIGILFHLFVIKTDYNFLEIFGIENSTLVNFNTAVSIAILAYGFLLIVPFAKEILIIVKYDRFRILSQQIKNDKIISKIEIEEGIRELLYLEKGLRETDYRVYHTYVLPELRYVGIKSAEKGCIDPTQLILDQLKDIELYLIDFNSSKLRRQIKILNHILTNLMKKNHNFDNYDLRETDIKNTVDCIIRMGLIATEKKLMISPQLPVASSSVGALGKIGVEAAIKKLSSKSVSFSQYGLLRIGIKAAETQLEQGDTLQFQQEISNRLVEIYGKTEDHEIRENSMKCLWLLSASIHLHPQYAINDWINEIKKKLKDDEAMWKLFESTYEELTVQLDSDKNLKIYPNIEKSLEKVRDLFYEEKK